MHADTDMTATSSLVHRPAAEDYGIEDMCDLAMVVRSCADNLYVSSIKIDPYLNVDAGTMNPKEYVRYPRAAIAQF